MHLGSVDMQKVEGIYYISRGDSHIQLDFRERVLVWASPAFPLLWAESVPPGRGHWPPPCLRHWVSCTCKAQKGNPPAALNPTCVS